jgi:hypothetical protein
LKTGVLYLVLIFIFFCWNFNCYFELFGWNSGLFGLTRMNFISSMELDLEYI